MREIDRSKTGQTGTDDTAGPTGLGSGDVEIIERKTVYKGFFRIEKFRLRHRMFAGGWTQEIDRELSERGDAVVVLLYDPKLDVVVMVEQFRVGALGAGLAAPWMTEPVAGMVGKGETPEEVARREAMEEAGCRIARLEHLYDVMPSPGGLSEYVHFFIGEIDASQAGGIHGLPEEHEDIKVHVLPIAEAIRRLDANSYQNASAVIAVGWLARHHQDVRRRWLENRTQAHAGKTASRMP